MNNVRGSTLIKTALIHTNWIHHTVHSRPPILRTCMPLISSNRPGRCTTTPLPITQVALGLRMPEGIRCSLYLLPSES